MLPLGRVNLFINGRVKSSREKRVFCDKTPFSLDSTWLPWISDKTFKEKAFKTLNDFLQDQHISRRVSQNQKHDDAWRIPTNKDSSGFAGWEGIWESSDGNFFFLSHGFLEFFQFQFQFQNFIYAFIPKKKVNLIHKKFEKSVVFLGLERSKATLYLAGDYWKLSIVGFTVWSWRFAEW